ncbi:MAG: cache domain-containing protein [Deltaproteobacteria bacterium]|nr:cache domain-containing protein [Deltaproteobacteria bacterium]
MRFRSRTSEKGRADLVFRSLPRALAGLKLRWKLMVVVLPLVLVPLGLVGAIVGTISTRQAYLGITQTSKADLDHMGQFALDLLNAHHRQFQVYKADKKKAMHDELATLVNFAYHLVEAQSRQHRRGRVDLATAEEEARKALKAVNIGASGYLYAMSSHGVLRVHVAREGEDISGERDEGGRFFIRAMCQAALRSKPGEVRYIVYPWRNAMLGDKYPRRKVVAYRYFREWDWIVAAGGYVDETYEDAAFERESFRELKARLKSKKVGKTGYIYAMTSRGDLTVHVSREGQNIYDERDQNGRYFIREMCRNKRGWIRYPWKNPGEPRPRMKIVRYDYFEPWDWIVAVGSYEDEFYREANVISGRIVRSLLVLVVLVGFGATVLVFQGSRVLTEPIGKMIGVIRKVKGGRFEERMEIDGDDELGELAAAFNRMAALLEKHKQLEADLAQQEKLASLGVLASGVAHEINNPLGVILGYAGHLEAKTDADDPRLRHIQEIRRESKRCKQIVQDLLSYARTRKAVREQTDVNELLGHIVEFASHHADMRAVEIAKDLAPGLPRVWADGDQLRQVALNLILNAGAAMEKGGTLSISTRETSDGEVEIVFEDEGCGIPAENLERIFEPFFTTRERGTGLGLAITKRLVEQNGGTIRVESELGRRTTVTLQLPTRSEGSP